MIGHWSPRFELIITILVVVLLLWKSRRNPKNRLASEGGSKPARNPEQGYFFHNDDLLLGGSIAAVLAFFAGLYLPMKLSPAANQGPLMGFFIAPLAGVAGAFLADRIAHARKSHLRWFLVATILGMTATPLFLAWEVKRPDANSGYTFYACLLFIFGVTGFVVQLRHLDTPPPPHSHP